MTKIKPPDSQTNPKGDSASCRHTPAMRKIRLGEKSKKEEDKKKGGGGSTRAATVLRFRYDVVSFPKSVCSRRLIK